MSRIEHVVFIAGGVAVPRLAELTLTALFPDGDAPPEIRLEALALERKLSHGAIMPDTYCRRLIEASGVDRQATRLAEAICWQIAPRTRVPSLLADLVARIDLQLVCDYPRNWWELASARHGLDQYFSSEENFYLAENRVPRDHREFFEVLVSAEIIQRGRSLWVDHHSPRTSAAIRCGIDAAIFVDAERLRRDLGLWDLLPLS